MSSTGPSPSGRYHQVALLDRMEALPATFAVLLIGLLVLLPFGLGEDLWTQYAAASPTATLAVLFLGIGCSRLAYLLWYAALKRSSAVSVASALYIQPLVTLLGGALLLHEPVLITTLSGGLLVLAGVYLVRRSDRAPAPRQPELTRPPRDWR